MDARFGKGVKKVIKIETDEDGRRSVTTVYQKSRPEKEMSPSFKGFEKVVRGATDGLRVFADTYKDHHQESNRRKSDGWMRDFAYNVYRSASKASDKLRLYPFPVPYAEQPDEED